MTPTEITRWLWQSRAAVIETLSLTDTWWPVKQGDASTLAAAFFLTATLARVGGPKEQLCVSAAWNKNDSRRKVVGRLWGVEHTALRCSEVLVDFSVHDWVRRAFLITGESEVHALHGDGDSMTTADDYSWDFFKLLVVRSPIRLFFARVGTSNRGEAVGRRIANLERSLTAIIAWGGQRFLDPSDQLGVVLLAATKEAATSSRVLHMDKGRLVGTDLKAIEGFPKLWKGR